MVDLQHDRLVWGFEYVIVCQWHGDSLWGGICESTKRTRGISKSVEDHAHARAHARARGHAHAHAHVHAHMYLRGGVAETRIKRRHDSSLALSQRPESGERLRSDRPPCAVPVGFYFKIVFSGCRV